MNPSFIYSDSAVIPPISPFFCPVHYHTQARVYCRVAVATLNTLAGYIDWVSLGHITSKNCQLLETLCLLLSEPELQLEAAECLLIAISRKVSQTRCVWFLCEPCCLEVCRMVEQ